jgi:hypothetical protein
MTLQNPTPRSLGWVIPPRYRTSLRLLYQGRVTASSATGEYFTIFANSLYQPFSTSAPVSTGGLIAATGGSASTESYPGYSILNGMYGAYRVVRSRVSVLCAPTSTGDQVTITVYPVQVESGSAGLQPFNAFGQPYAKSRLCVQGAPISQQTVRQSMESHVILGLTKSQYENLPVTYSGSQPSAANAWYWACQWSMIDGAVNTGILAFQVMVECDVEMSLPLTLTN